jgi:hypothetical protein
LFIDIIDELFDILTIGLWVSVCRRLSVSVLPIYQNDQVAELFFSTAHNCPFADDSALDGIISYLTWKCGDYIGDRGIVSISASSIDNLISHLLRSITDFEDRNYFCTNNEPISWVCYDFKNMYIKPTHYSIRFRRDGNDNHMRTWTLEGFIDGQSWEELDRQENNKSLNSQGATVTFSISRSLEIQMIRLRQLSQKSSWNNHMVMNAIELFGIIVEPTK